MRASAPGRTGAVGLALALGLGVAGPCPSGGVTVTRSFHANGRPFEVRRFKQGRETGLQQAWTEEGVPYLNYEMRDGRRYGYVNARPCAPVAATP